MPKPRKPKTPSTCPLPERRVVMAVVGAPHGVRGEARVKSFAGDPLAIADYGTLFAADGTAFDIENGRLLKDDMLVVKFTHLATPEAVKALTGTELFVDRANLPEPDEEEFYHADLIGLDVAEAGGEPFGRILAIHDYGAGDILEIRPASGGGTWLLPFTKAAAPVIDLAARRVTIDAAFLTKPEARSPEAGDEP
ncbi:MAG TPA: ribosome maturation factor RimM [Rhabdaerophilum sp.]|nr:ribosome maturation factor RimM [Rhabdaerophilum sp.]